MSASSPRVAHVLGTMGRGGVPEVAYQLLERLPDTERWLYCLTDRCADPDARDRRLARLRAAGVRARLVPADPTGGTAEAAAQVAAWAQADRVDIVHTHSTRPNRTARPAALRHGLRVVSHYHNQYDDKWTTARDLAREGALAQASAGLVACSIAVRDHLVDRLELDPAAVTVVPNGVDLGRVRGGDPCRLRAELGLAAGTPLVGSVGRLCRQKATADVLRAARILAERHPDAVVVLAGAADDPALEAELRRLAAELGLGDRLRLLGYREDVADLYAALDVVVLASHWEGFGLVLVEAMAAGTPVVATAVGGIPEVVGVGRPGGPAARLVPPADPAALAHAVAGLLEDRAAARVLTTRGTERAGAFSWDAAAAGVRSLYDDLLTGDGRARAAGRRS